jgi:hypothetical protein
MERLRGASFWQPQFLPDYEYHLVLGFRTWLAIHDSHCFPVKSVEVLFDEYNDGGLVSHNDETRWPQDAIHFKEQVFSTAASLVEVGENCPRMEKIVCSRISRERLTPANTL